MPEKYSRLYKEVRQIKFDKDKRVFRVLGEDNAELGLGSVVCVGSEILRLDSDAHSFRLILRDSKKEFEHQALELTKMRGADYFSVSQPTEVRLDGIKVRYGIATMYAENIVHSNTRANGDARFR